MNVGIDGTGALTYRDVVSYGRVQALGAVVVNGAVYDVQGSSFTIDSRAGSAADLDVGDVVLLQGKVDEASGRGIAASIVSDHVLEGRIEALDPAQKTLQVLSQVVRLDADTRFDSSIAGGMAGLTPGDYINVSGFREIKGAVVATRIERQPTGQTNSKTTGAIIQLSKLERWLQIDELVVDYRNAVLLPSGAELVFAPGLFVEVRGTKQNANTFVASSVEIKRREVPGAANTRADLEGYVTSLNPADPSSMRIDGLPVNLNQDTQIKGNLTTSERVAVNGALNTAGTVIANSVVTILVPAGPTQTVQVRVFDALAGPVANARLDLWVGTSTGGYAYTWATNIAPVTGADGRVSTIIPAGASLMVTGVRQSGSNSLKPCVARVKDAGLLEAEVVAESTLNSLNPPPPLSAAGTVTMSGTIFEMTAAGRQPIAGARVWFEESMGIVFATTISDLSGHYLICNLQGDLPEIGGIDVVVQKSGFADVTVTPVNRTQSTVVDIEMKRSP